VLVVLAFTALLALALELRSPQTWMCDAQRISKWRVVNWAVAPGAAGLILTGFAFERGVRQDMGSPLGSWEVSIDSLTNWCVCGFAIGTLREGPKIPLVLLQVPLAASAALLGAFPGVVASCWLHRRYRRYRRVRTGLCFTCGYHLRGSVSGMCSECGRTLWQSGLLAPGQTPEARQQAGDAVREYPPARLLWPFCGGAPSAWVWPVGLLLAGGYVHACSVPGGLWAMYGRAAYLIAPIALAAILLMLVDFIGRVLSVGLRRPGHSAQSRLRRWTRACRWLALPPCLALVVSAGVSLWPLRVRFEWSREAFEGALRNVPRRSGYESASKQVGLFDVHRVVVSHEKASGVQFFPPRDYLVFFQTGQVGMDNVGFSNWTSDYSVFSCWSRRLTPRWVVDQRVH